MPEIDFAVWLGVTSLALSMFFSVLRTGAVAIRWEFV